VKFGQNKIHPLEIEDAREAAYRASELQKEVEDSVRDASKAAAEAERKYREALTVRILDLHANDGVAWTACEAIARGEKAVAALRYDRDLKEGLLEAARQQAFRRGADRRDLDTLLNWSMRRDLRVDSEPTERQLAAVGGGRAS
jgi:hypothetical protein